MFRKLDDFYSAQQHHVAEFCKNIAALTPESLMFAAYDGSRTIGQLAWHIVQTIPEMMARTGLSLEFDESLPIPNDPTEIARTYTEAHAKLAEVLKANWDDSSLEVEDELYGSKWKRGATLSVLLAHENHHHGQLTVMMRLASVPVHGVMGPSKEEWKMFGMEAPPEPQQAG